MKKKTVWISLLFLALIASVPTFGANADRTFDPVSSITNGVDLWRTAGDGGTFISFAENPLPADFLCLGSAPFRGRVDLVGSPIVTQPEGAFSLADTVIQRLDDAIFDEAGVATTRVQVRALSLVNVQPIKTDCGLFNLAAHLAAGDQPLTTMRIVQTEDNGGTLETPLDLNVHLVFTRADEKAGVRHDLIMPISFPAASFLWSRDANPDDLDKPGFVVLDTDGDQRPDTSVPGTSNFSPRPRYVEAFTPEFCQMNPEECSCHNSHGEQHCIFN